MHAIFGPSDHVLGLHIINSICDALDIPHLETRPDLDLLVQDVDGANEYAADGRAGGESAFHDALNASPGDIPPSVLLSASSSFIEKNGIAAGNQQRQQQQQSSPPPRARRRFAINLYPAQQLINAALLDVVQYLNWTRFAIVFEGSDGKDISLQFVLVALFLMSIHTTGLIKFRDFMRLLPHVDIYLRHVEPHNYANVLADIKNREIYNLIVDTDVRHLQQFLRGILQIQMNEYKYHYLFTTFDLETFDLEDFKYNFVNVTSFRLIDSEDIAVRDTLKDMRQFYLREDFKSNFLRHKGRMIEVGRECHWLTDS